MQEAPRCAFCHAGLDLLVALFPRAHAVADAVADGGGCKYLRSRGRGFLPRKSVCRRCQRGMRHVPLQQPRSAATTRYIGSRPTRLAERLKTKAGGEWSSPSSSPSMTTTSASGRERFFLFPGPESSFAVVCALYSASASGTVRDVGLLQCVMTAYSACVCVYTEPEPSVLSPIPYDAALCFGGSRNRFGGAFLERYTSGLHVCIGRSVMTHRTVQLCRIIYTLSRLYTETVYGVNHSSLHVPEPRTERSFSRYKTGRTLSARD